MYIVHLQDDLDLYLFTFGFLFFLCFFVIQGNFCVLNDSLCLSPSVARILQ